MRVHAGSSPAEATKYITTPEPLVYMDRYVIGIRFNAKEYLESRGYGRGSAKYKSMKELDPTLED